MNVFLNGFGDVCIEDSFLLVCSTDNNLGITLVFFFSQPYHACSKSDNHLVRTFNHRTRYQGRQFTHSNHVSGYLLEHNTEIWNFLLTFLKYDNLNPVDR